MTSQPPRQWTDADQALLYTYYLAGDVLAGRPCRPAPVSAPFRPQLSPAERFLASGPAVLMAAAPPPAGSPSPAPPAWQVRHRGWVTVSDEGLYVQDPSALVVWDWPMIHAAQIVGMNQLTLTVVHPDGPVAWWLLQSPYAELAFVLWAHAMHPEHPQLAGVDWLPPRWLPWAQALGKVPVSPGR